MRTAAVALALAAAVVPGPAPAAAAKQVCVAVVVDFAELNAPTTRTCVEVPEGSTGADVLAARAKQLGTPAPRYDGNFLCAIDGRPADGCATRSGSQYTYWSYWHRVNGRWQYATTGVAEYRVQDADGDGWADVDGWRWITDSGSGERSGPPATDYADVCPTTSPTPRASRTPTRPSASRTAAPPATRAPGAAGRTGAPSVATGSATPSAGGTATPSNPAATSPAATAGAPDDSADPSPDRGAARVAEPPVSRAARHLPVGTIAGLALLGALGLAAALRFRGAGP